MKKIVVGLMAFLVVGLITTAGFVSAYKWDNKGPNYNEERHQAMEKAFDSKDYDAWYKLMSEKGRHSRVLEIVTRDNFNQFVKIHEAKEKGDYETVKKLREELGLGMGKRNGCKFSK